MAITIGLESEYLLLSTTIDRIQHLVGSNGIAEEFYRFMVEVTTDPWGSPRLAVTQLEARVRALEAHVSLNPFSYYLEADPQITFRDVTKDTPYYRWVYYEACRRLGKHPFDLHYVGIHINAADASMSDNAYIAAASWLRSWSWIFILLTANSPFRQGRASVVLSRRMLQFPNRYDVPYWQGGGEFRQWMRKEEVARRVYPGRARCWMTVCPRVVGNDLDQPFERIEVRSLDGGRAVTAGIIEGCCSLVIRLLENRETRSLPHLSDLEANDKTVAAVGRNAAVVNGRKTRPALEVARWWCQGISALEEVLECGSPAEQVLRHL